MHPSKPSSNVASPRRRSLNTPSHCQAHSWVVSQCPTASSVSKYLSVLWFIGSYVTFPCSARGRVYVLFISTDPAPVTWRGTG